MVIMTFAGICEDVEEVRKYLSKKFGIEKKARQI